MVSNARLDFPEPESPVTTIMRSRGMSTETLRRLWTRAPWTAIVVLGAVRAEDLVGIRRLGREEGELLHRDVAAPRQQDVGGRLVDHADVGQILARRRDSFDRVRLPEVVVDVAAGADVAVLAQVIEHGPEHLRCARADVLLDRRQGAL